MSNSVHNMSKQEPGKENILRLSRFIADAGVVSRRKAESLIADGRVRVNGVTVREQGIKVDPASDTVDVDGLRLGKPEKVYILLNKPREYISSVHDPQGRPTVLDLVKDIQLRLYPVGRLDYDTEGLLLLTNDGGFCNLMTHPRHAIWKKYEVWVRGRVAESSLLLLKKGVILDDGGITSPARVKILGYHHNMTRLEIKIREGKKRQIKRMCSSIGHEVVSLKRTAFAFLTLKGVPCGKYRYLSGREVNILKKMAQIKGK